MKSLILSSKFWDRFIPVRFDAINLYLVILVRKEFLKDKALMVHEQYHTQQVEAHGPIYIWRYHKNPEFRMRMEAQAYAKQVMAGGNLLDAVNSLYNNYDLNVMHGECYIMIREYVMEYSKDEI